MIAYVANAANDAGSTIDMWILWGVPGLVVLCSLGKSGWFDFGPSKKAIRREKFDRVLKSAVDQQANLLREAAYVRSQLDSAYEQAKRDIM